MPQDPIALFPLSSLPNPGSREAVIPQDDGQSLSLFVVRAGDVVRAYANICPHQQVPLNWKPDVFLTTDRAHIQCSLHGALFRIEDGLCIHGPCAERSLTPLAVRVEKGVVVLEGGATPSRGA